MSKTTLRKVKEILDKNEVYKLNSILDEEIGDCYDDFKRNYKRVRLKFKIIEILAFRDKKYELKFEHLKQIMDQEYNTHNWDINLFRLAIKNNHQQMIKYLIKRFHIIILEKYIEEAMDIYHIYTSNEEVYRSFFYLTKYNASVFESDLGYEMLKIACKDGDFEVVKNLIIDQTLITRTNSYAFRLAAKYGHNDIVNLFLKNNVKVDAKNNYALIQSVKHNHLEVVKSILMHKKKRKMLSSVEETIYKKLVLTQNIEMIKVFNKFYFNQ